VLVPRASTLTWDSPNANGPIVAEHAELRFILENTGRQRVRVLGIDAACGCVKPVAEPPDVEPAAATTIVVKAITPSTGTRIMPLTVHTDSPVQPDVRLTAKMTVRRKPPFLYDVNGDLTFRGAFAPSLTADISVVTFESSKEDAEPQVSTDLPFLKIERAGDFVESTSSVADVAVVGPFFIRRRRYRVRFREAPAENAFVGTVTVTDPFRRAADRTLKVIGQLSAKAAPLVTPAATTFRREKDAKRTFMVICDPPASSILCSVDACFAGGLTVDSSRAGPGGRIHKVTIVVADPAQLGTGPAHLRVRDAQAGTEGTALLYATE
jgi:hypothetical protein